MSKQPHSYTTNLSLPTGLSPQEARDAIISEVVDKVAPKFTFAYYSLNDARQQAWMFALEAIDSPKYNADKPLEKFLYVSVSNKFLNLRRKEFVRNAPPCECCPFARGRDDCDLYAEKSDCDKYTSWQARNRAKMSLGNIAQGGDDTIDRESINTVTNECISNELQTFILSNLDEHSHHAHDCLLNSGMKLSTQALRKLESNILLLINNYYEH